MQRGAPALLLWLLGCAPRPEVPSDPLGLHVHAAAELAARARVPDPARGGPPLRADSSPLPPFTGVSRASARYVGDEVCGACHPAVREALADTRHAHAMGTLAQAQSSFNPDCFRCHVTGYGHPGGYVGARTPTFAHVGCEACHGPGSDHVAAPARGFGDLPRDASACVGCHTHDTSPDFTWESRWPLLAHGVTVRASAAPR